jgi:hypothetical protein
VGQRISDLSCKVDYPGFPSNEALVHAWRVADGLLRVDTPPPSVLPGEEGSVELIWERGSWHVELELVPGANWIWAKCRATGDTVSGELDEHRDIIRDILEEIANS